MQMDRRTFLHGVCGGALAAAMPFERQETEQIAAIPSYLKGYEKQYAVSPRGAALAWFRDARYGLFMHYGVSSILGKGEWVMFRDKIPLGEYEKLKDRFDPAAFDADFITDMALEAGMRYVNITSRHHDSFCLFESSHSDYTSANTRCRRDLVRELSAQCEKKGLGLFLYYSYALDWRHPYFYPRKFIDIARPAYSEPEPRYLWSKDDDFARYIEFVHGQLRELLTHYGPLAGIWFDPIMGFYARPDLYPIQETYARVRALQPQILISFKQGATGTEDFAAPERHGRSLADRVRQRLGPDRAEVAERAWMCNRAKHNEICDTMQPGAWGYKAADDKKHRTPDQVKKMLASAYRQNCNLLLNTGPLPDGSIHPADVRVFREVGRRIRAEGYPE